MGIDSRTATRSSRGARCRLAQCALHLGVALVLLGLGALGGACNALTGVDDLVVGAGGTASGGASTTTSTTHSTTSTAGGGGTGAATGAGGTGGAPPDPCEGVTCSSHGSCFVNAQSQAECDCNEGYHAVGLSCVVDESCSGVDCGRCSQCEVIDGIATCTCPDGFAHQAGFGCRPSPNPCDNPAVQCGPEQVCIPEHHCIAQAVCVDTCDCSNCGDCNMQDFVNTGAWALYCGGGQSGPATITCTKPCPGGQGCIPYSPPICWGGQGCISG